MSTRAKGFTLVEVIVVVVIIGVLATVAVQRYRQVGETNNAGEVLQIFSELRRSATICAATHDNSAAACANPANLEVTVRQSPLFWYSSCGNGTELIFMAASAHAPKSPTICLVINTTTSAVTYYLGRSPYQGPPITNIYDGPVSKAGTIDRSMDCGHEIFASCSGGGGASFMF